MPGYNPNQIHVDRPMTELALSYTNEELIGTKLMPEIKTEHRSNLYFVRSKANQLRSMDLSLSALGPPALVEQGISTNSYACRDYGDMARVAVSDEANADLPLNLRQDATMDAVALLKLAQEIRIAAKVTNASLYNTNNTVALSGVDRWDVTGSDVLGPIAQYSSAIFPSPNTKKIAWFDQLTWNIVKNHAQIIGRISGGATTSMVAKVMRQMFAELIEVDEVIVGSAWKIGSNPGQADVQSRVWSKGFGILRVATAPSTRSLHFGSSFVFRQEQITSWLDQLPGLEGVFNFKCTHSTDEQVVANDAGMFIQTPIS
jgi:hypothetical protein